jgi:nuclear transport factor 2 (NTF2) superfamily protein
MSRADKYEHLKKLIQAFSEPYRDTVYHYTSADGISGIIDKHEIWMSNTAFMNDTTELKALEKATGIKDSDFTNDAVKEAWRRRGNRAGIHEMNQYYMASFSKKKDSLEQWRAYGNFCIGFDATKLAIKRHISLYECLYNEDAIREWILAEEKIPEWTSLPDEDQRNNAAYNLLYVASMKYKNKCFSTEEEIRLVATSYHNWGYLDSPGRHEDDLPIHFRPHRLYGFPVPYLKFFIERESNNRPQGTQETEPQWKERKLNEEAAKPRELLPITEVIVGPMAYQREAITACNILLSERGYKQLPVTVSDIPYRGI